MSGKNPLRELFSQLPSPSSQLPEEVAAIPESGLDYFILVTARSGSTRLCQEIALGGDLAYPREWFNPRSIANAVTQYNVTFETYVATLRRLYAGPTGLFGTKIAWPQLGAVRSMVDLESTFAAPARWVYLRRRNAVAQSVSHHLAIATGVWHRPSTTPPVDGGDGAPEFDGVELEGFYDRLIDIELAIERYLKKRNIVPLRLYYEDIAPDFGRAAAAVSSWVGEGPFPVDDGVEARRDELRSRYLRGFVDDPRPRQTMARLASEVNREFEERFRSGHAAFLAEADQRRPPLV